MLLLALALTAVPCGDAVRLARAQADLPDAQGRPVAATWAWQAGERTAARNTAGVVALTLLEAPAACGPEVDAALARYAEARLEEHGRGLFLFDPDVEALARLSERLERPELFRAAHEAFERRYGGAEAGEFVSRWSAVLGRGPLVGFDAALAVRAALSVGEREQAQALAEAVLAATPGWGRGRRAWLIASRGALLEALRRLGPDRNAEAIAGLEVELLADQDPDGSFAGSDQATAYALIALERADRRLAGRAIRRARSWLNGQKSGVLEVQAEVARAP